MHQPKKQALAPLLSLHKRSMECASIAHLLQQAQKRTSLDDTVNMCLADHFKGHFKVNSLQAGVLTLTCSSAKLMTQFRMQQTSFINKLNSEVVSSRVSSIVIKIRPALHQKKPIEQANRTISKKNAQILLQEAEHTADQNLKNVLCRLANHACRD